jgi:hypothetical protein
MRTRARARRAGIRDGGSDNVDFCGVRILRAAVTLNEIGAPSSDAASRIVTAC